MSTERAGELRAVLTSNLDEGFHNRIGRVMPAPIGRIRLPEQPLRPMPLIVDPPQPDVVSFTDVDRAARELRDAVQRLIDDEERLVREEMAEQERVNAWIVGPVRSHYNEAGPLLRQAVELSLDALDAYLDNVLRPHEDAPRRLEQEGEELRDHGETTRGIANDMAGLVEAEAWQGEAADGYRQAATVQYKATTELAGVMLSSGAALLRAADLNRATFFLVAERLRMARRTIDSLTRMGLIGGQHYTRLRLAASQLRSVLSQTQEMVESVQSGQAATELAGQLDNLADMPHLLDPLTWPTGVDRADREPADTASAITRD